MRPADITTNPLTHEQMAAQVEAATSSIVQSVQQRLSANEQEFQAWVVSLRSRLTQEALRSARTMHLMRLKTPISGQEKFVCVVVGALCVFALPVVGSALAGSLGRTGGRLAERKLGLSDEP